MSEYWHNGSIIFDRALTPKEKEGAASFFSDCYPRSQRGFFVSDTPLKTIYPLEYRSSSPSYGDPGTSTYSPDPTVTVFDFEDFLTGRDFDETLESLVSWCRENHVGIDKTSLLSYYGSDDGAYDFPDGELRCLDRDEYGVLNASSEFLIEEIMNRENALRNLLHSIRTSLLLAELQRRNIADTAAVNAAGYDLFQAPPAVLEGAPNPYRIDA